MRSGIGAIARSLRCKARARARQAQAQQSTANSSSKHDADEPDGLARTHAWHGISAATRIHPWLGAAHEVSPCGAGVGRDGRRRRHECES